jgi:hypothetical protein
MAILLDVTASAEIETAIARNLAVNQGWIDYFATEDLTTGSL